MNVALMSLILSGLSALVATIATLTLIKHRTDTLKENETKLAENLDKKANELQSKIDGVFNKISTIVTQLDSSFKADVKQAAAELSAATATIRALQVEQSVINRVINETLNGINNKIDKIEHLLNDHEARLRVIEHDN